MDHMLGEGWYLINLMGVTFIHTSIKVIRSQQRHLQSEGPNKAYLQTKPIFELPEYSEVYVGAICWEMGHLCPA